MRNKIIKSVIYFLSFVILLSITWYLFIRIISPFNRVKLIILNKEDLAYNSSSLGICEWRSRYLQSSHDSFRYFLSVINYSYFIIKNETYCCLTDLIIWMCAYRNYLQSISTDFNEEQNNEKVGRLRWYFLVFVPGNCKRGNLQSRT